MPLFLTLLIAVGFISTSTAHAEEATANIPVSHIEIETPYAFATMPGGITGAVFMTIKNTGNLDDVLTEVKSDIAKITEIHENFIDPDNSKMTMRKIKNITLPKGEKITLEPKGKHLMLIKLTEPLTLDSYFPVTLVFKNAEKKIVKVKVIQPGKTPNIEHDHDMHEHH